MSEIKRKIEKLEELRPDSQYEMIKEIWMMLKFEENK